MRICIRSINQSNRSISVRLLFLFCSRVFVSRSYENRPTRRMNTANIEPNITPFKSLDVIGSLGKQEGQFTIFWGKNTLSCTCLHLLFRSTHDVRAQISATHVQSYSSNTSRWVVGTTDISTSLRPFRIPCEGMLICIQIFRFYSFRTIYTLFTLEI